MKQVVTESVGAAIAPIKQEVASLRARASKLEQGSAPTNNAGTSSQIRELRTLVS